VWHRPPALARFDVSRRGALFGCEDQVKNGPPQTGDCRTEWGPFRRARCRTISKIESWRFRKIDRALPLAQNLAAIAAIHANRPTLPVILCTGHADHDLLKEFNELRILQKPAARLNLDH